MEGGPAELQGVLREANAAHARCRRLQPTAWVAALDDRRQEAAFMEEPLQLMVELQRNSLRAPPGRANASIEQLSWLLLCAAVLLFGRLCKKHCKHTTAMCTSHAVAAGVAP